MFVRLLTLLLGALALFLVIVPFALWLGGVDVYGAPPSKEGEVREETLMRDRTMWRSYDGARSWSAVVWHVPFSLNETTAFALHPQDAAIMYAGTRASGIWKSVDHGTSWIRAGELGAIDRETAVFRVVIAPSDPRVVYALYSRDQRGRVGVSTDAGFSFREIYGVPQEGRAVYDLWVNPSRASHVMIATSQGGVLVSQDTGVSWKAMQWLNEPIVMVTADPHATDHMHVMTLRGIIYTSFGGEEWTPAGKDVYEKGAGDELPFSIASVSALLTRIGRGALLPARKIMLIRDSLISSRFYMVTREGFYRSEDNAISWMRVELPVSPELSRVDAIAVSPFDSDIFYVAAGERVYLTHDGGITWAMKTLAMQRIQLMAVSSADPNFIVIISEK